jgi:hypothetical protein
MLVGSIASLGSHYVIDLDAINCQSGDHLASEQVEVDSKERVLDGVGKGVSRLREKLGESLTSIQKFDKPLREATTSSLEALKEFSSGSQKTHEGREPEAIPHFQHATELDPISPWLTPCWRSCTPTLARARRPPLTNRRLMHCGSGSASAKNLASRGDTTGW